jgi:hypothetical protein
MTNEQLLKRWAEAEVLWTAASGGTWDIVWGNLFGNTHRYPYSDENDDGEGGIGGERGIIVIGDTPNSPGAGNVMVRINPPHKQEIRL